MDPEKRFPRQHLNILKKNPSSLILFDPKIPQSPHVLRAFLIIEEEFFQQMKVSAAQQRELRFLRCSLKTKAALQQSLLSEYNKKLGPSEVPREIQQQQKSGDFLGYRCLFRSNLTSISTQKWVVYNLCTQFSLAHLRTQVSSLQEAENDTGGREIGIFDTHIIEGHVRQFIEYSMKLSSSRGAFSRHIRTQIKALGDSP